MGDEWEQGPAPEPGEPNNDDFDKRVEEIRRMVIQGTSEAQQRLKRVVDRAGEYWQQTNSTPQPRPVQVAHSRRPVLLQAVHDITSSSPSTRVRVSGALRPVTTGSS